jgi:hypothetical protein
LQARHKLLKLWWQIIQFGIAALHFVKSLMLEELLLKQTLLTLLYIFDMQFWSILFLLQLIEIGVTNNSKPIWHTIHVLSLAHIRQFEEQVDCLFNEQTDVRLPKMTAEPWKQAAKWYASYFDRNCHLKQRMVHMPNK